MPDVKETSKAPLHPVQMQILNKMIFKPKARFKDLRVKNLTTDHFTYHINKLLDLGLIIKKDGEYILTEFGKKFVSIMDTERAVHEQFGKRGVLLKAARLKKGSKVFEYLVYKRLKQPFYGYYGFHTGKVRFGETIVDAAFREFKEETGLEIVDYELIGIYHQIGVRADGTVLRDVYFYEFHIYDFKGKLLEVNKKEGVYNMWLTKNELKKVPTYPDFWNSKLKLNWTHFPKFYARYKKLKTAGKWQNKPKKTSSTNDFHEIKPYFVERIKVIKEW